MFTREQFLKWRFKHPEKSDFTYEQYLHWAYQKQTHQRNIKLLIASHIFLLILGIIVGAALS
jgi:hypothetical protein